jgi:hypothetical protein
MIGQNERIEVRSIMAPGDRVLRIRKQNSDFEVIPEQVRSGPNTGLFVHDQIEEAGNYFISDGEEYLSGLSFNYDRSESDLSVYSAAQLSEIAFRAGITNMMVLEPKDKDLAVVIEEMQLGVRLWKLFLILALVFLAAEIALLRLWK